MSIDLNKSNESDGNGGILRGNVSVPEFDVSESGDETHDFNDPENGVDSGFIDNGREAEVNTETAHNNSVGETNDLDSLDAVKRSYESRLEVGTCFGTLHEVHKLYSDYATVMGFSVRKSNQEYLNRNKDIRMKLFLCSCAGSTDNKASLDRLPAFKKQSYRSKCKAMLRVSRADMESPWKITSFAKHHSHELVNPTESYMLRSARNMSRQQKNLLISMRASGIGVSRAYRFLENEARSRQNIGFIRKDVYNALHSEARDISKVDNGDANRLMEILTERGMSDPSFFWKVKLSDSGRLECLFFRDSRCLTDYQHFGDVVSVDATYKTNKYDLICVPLVGLNHHRTNVMFGLTFLTNKKSESYQWLFTTFLQAMYHKEPSVVFSDQDMALMNAFDVTFRHASHRLCQWHVNKNAVKHFGKLNHDQNFKNHWYRCMNGCENEEEFELIWKRMIEEFGLFDNKWFCTMHKLRKRWSSAFTCDKFFGGLHATSQSEVTNRVLKELCSTTSTLHEFVVGFEKLQKSWRTREFEEDALCRGMPGMFVQRTRLLIQVAEVCTRTVFKLFEYEAVNSISVDLTAVAPDLNGVVNDGILEFKLSSCSSLTGFRVVKYNEVSKIASCSCHLWETDGIICRHIFRVFLHFNQHRIPEEMLLNRWRKDAKQRISLSDRLSESGGANKFKNMVFVNHYTKLVYDLLTECKDDGGCRDLISQSICNLIDDVKSLKLDTTDTTVEEVSKEPLVRLVKNPNSQKKRPYRRMRFSKEREARVMMVPQQRIRCMDFVYEIWPLKGLMIERIL